MKQALIFDEIPSVTITVSGDGKAIAECYDRMSDDTTSVDLTRTDLGGILIRAYIASFTGRGK